MRNLGLVGAVRGKVKRTAIAPNVLWVADITYVSSWSGWVYVASVIARPGGPTCGPSRAS